MRVLLTLLNDAHRLIQDMSNDVDRTDSRLATANQRMQRFIDENRNSKSSWCILILIIVR